MSGTKKKGRIVEATGEDVRKYAASAGGEGASESARGADAAVSAVESDGVNELRDKLLRARAELANVQRRSAQEKSEAVRFAVADLARDVLGVVDDFGRALEAADADAGGNEGIVEGARLAYENLMRILKAHQVERVVAEGEPFDPTCHEAVMQEPSAEHPPQTVLREVQAGYRLAGRLLRPSKVIIASAPPNEGAVETPED